ncbi:MAG: GNAT family N-acetyltransferase [Planctomycetota bacterium]|nr:GNAT family N-acetyltransferase [Planctomycetota bacterium]
MPPPGGLADEAIELRVIRVLGAGDVEARPVEARFLSRAPEYRFAIHRVGDGLRVGRIHLRGTHDPLIVGTLGHTGYAVDEPHRRKGYATRAVRLIVGLARNWGVLPLWVVIEPDNIASRRTVERAGFRLVEEIDTPPEALALGTGPRVCRYVFE